MPTNRKKRQCFYFPVKNFLPLLQSKKLWKKDFRKNAKERTLIFIYKKMVLNSVRVSKLFINFFLAKYDTVYTIQRP
jgi:hypothetical protein